VGFTCPSFTASDTNDALRSTVSCSFSLCPFQSVFLSYCGPCGDGNEIIRLYDSQDREITTNAALSCGSCTGASYSYSKSNISCESFTLRQGCVGNSTCSGGAIFTIYSPLIEVKYGAAVIFNDTSQTDSTTGLVVKYFYNPPKGETLRLPLVLNYPSSPCLSDIFLPVSMPEFNSELLSTEDLFPEKGWFLLKWRPIVANWNTKSLSLPSSSLSSVDHIVAVGQWEGSILIKSHAFKFWIVSSVTRNLLGFVLHGPSAAVSLPHLPDLHFPSPPDSNAALYLIYLFDDLLTQPTSGGGGRTTNQFIPFSFPSSSVNQRLLTEIIGSGMTLGSNFSVADIRRYVPGLSNRRIYLLDSSLNPFPLTFT
jgi:hypothetical protein